ncbi:MULTISPECIES: hypothetical protein [unclassified Psychrobacter]|uniref:hypothetical protein n=1 Tax=unclassified Psychrobacter TaxID=196806 RepID=UPI0025F8BFAC|nr:MULTISPECIES: hypothetical protein [unclassified Psychrobacter]
MIERLSSLNHQVSNHATIRPTGRIFDHISNFGITSLILMVSLSVQAAPTVNNANPAAETANTALASNNVTQLAPLNTASINAVTTVPASATNAKPATDISSTLAAQLQPSAKALSEANQELLSRNAQLQRQVNDLQTQVNVLVYESKGQLFLYGAFTVLVSLLVGIFISWLVFVRRDRW